MSIDFRDNSNEILTKIAVAKRKSLFEVGELVHDAWAEEINARHVIDTGRFRASTRHQEDKDFTEIGTPINNPPYPIYLELGTSKMKARPTLEPAVNKSKGKVKDIVETVFKNG